MISLLSIMSHLFVLIMLLVSIVHASFNITTIYNCCDTSIVNEPLSLLDCVENSKSNINDNNKLIVTYMSNGDANNPYSISDIYNFSSYQAAIMASYAEYHSYNFDIFSDSTNSNYEPDDKRWNKIMILYNRMIQHENIEYIMWIDADAIVLNMEFSFEDLLLQYHQSDLIASSDIRMGFINTGIMIIRNTLWMRRFLFNWWIIADRKKVCDQDAFDILYSLYSSNKSCTLNIDCHKDDAKLIHNKIKILPMNGINSHPPVMTYQSINDPVMHLMGEITELRHVVFKRAFHSICMTNLNISVPIQLGVSQQEVLLIALDVYQNDVQTLFNMGTYNDSVHFFSDDNSMFSMVRRFDNLSKSVHHLCDAYATINNSTSLLECKKLREKAFRLFYEQLKVLQNLSLSQTINKQVLVLLLKRAAEAGNDLFGVMYDIDEKYKVAELIFGILEELYNNLADESRPVPLHMTALMYQNLGKMEYNLALNITSDDEQKKHFLKSKDFYSNSLHIFEKTFSGSTDSSTNREYAIVMQMVSTLSCLLEDFDNAKNMWQNTILKARSNLKGVSFGIDVDVLIMILYNAAVCYHEAKLYDDALLFLSEILNTYKSQQTLHDSYLNLAYLLQSRIMDEHKLFDQYSDDINIIYDSEQWEDCDEGDTDCEVVYIADHNSMTENVVDFSGMDEGEITELGEIRSRYLTQSTKFIDLSESEIKDEIDELKRDAVELLTRIKNLEDKMK